MEIGTVGVVIRTLNESELLGRCLAVLQRQHPGFHLDILVVDSGSTDATVAIAESQGARVVHLSPDDFDYSTALNVGLDQVHGDLVLILSAHAIPVDDSWIAQMVAPFEDPRVAGVASRQVPWADAPWREVLRLARTFGKTSRRYTKDDSTEILFSNAASCIRHAAWLEERFTLPAAEDLEWAQRLVAAGWTIVYEAAAVVHHSHHESARDQARRMIDLHRVVADGSQRTLRRTLREAARFLVVDSGAILRLDDPLRRKCGQLAELVQMVGFYVLDFPRAGTTAQRRREDANSAA